MLHFLKPRWYERIMPPYVPRHRELVYASGAAEIAGGLATMNPATRRFGSAWSILTLLAIFPANVHMAIEAERFEGGPGGRNALYAAATGPAAVHRLGVRRRRLGLAPPPSLYERVHRRRSRGATRLIMVLKRVIPCLDVDAGRVVKGTNFVDIRDAGDPVELAERYDAEGADELVFLDITASHESRDTIVDLARRTADNVFIPFTIGGGIRSVEDAQAVLDAGADKVSVNSSALERPELIAELAEVFGSQCVVIAIDAKRCAPGGGREAERPANGSVGRLRARRTDQDRGPGGRRLGARGDRARRGRGAADEHGSRRHE